MTTTEIDTTTDRLAVPTDEIAGLVAARKSLGPDSEQAVITGFLTQAGHAIDERVEARLAEATRPASGRPSTMVVALASLGTGVAVPFVAGIQGMAIGVVWLAIALIYVAFVASPRFKI